MAHVPLVQGFKQLHAQAMLQRVVYYESLGHKAPLQAATWPECCMFVLFGGAAGYARPAAS